MVNQIIRRPIPEGISIGSLEQAVQIAPELNQAQPFQPSQKIDELLGSYKAFKRNDSIYQTIDYDENDIVALVEHVGEQESGTYEHSTIGTYIGNLISNLTQNNEKIGKRTIIEIPVNKVDYLGKICDKFDVIKIGENLGKDVFSYSGNGNMLYVKNCKGSGFAQGIGQGGKLVHIVAAEEINGENFANGAFNVGIIAAKTVNGGNFGFLAGRCNGSHIGALVAGIVRGNTSAYEAGSDFGKVDLIAARDVDCNEFAQRAGSNEGYVGKILAGRILGETKFAESAGHYDGRVDIIGGKEIISNNFAIGLHSRIQKTARILKGHDAEMEYKLSLLPVVQELGKYGLDFIDLLNI